MSSSGICGFVGCPVKVVQGPQRPSRPRTSCTSRFGHRSGPIDRWIYPPASGVMEPPPQDGWGLTVIVCHPVGSIRLIGSSLAYRYLCKVAGPVELQDIDGAVEVRTSNGHVRAEGIRGAFDAITSNSSIHAALDKVDGAVRAQSSNGGIELSLPPDSQSAVRAHTSNSGITLHLPGEVNARLSAETSNSSISSDFEMRVRGEISKHHIEGSIGNGGPLIDLSTSNGPIRIMK